MIFTLLGALFIVVVVFGIIHTVVTIVALVLGIVAVASNRGRRAGIAGLTLTALANVVAGTVVFLVVQAMGAYTA